MRYRQSAIGVGWVILQPLMTMVVFTAVFGKFVGVPSDGLPYPIFIFSALLPWNLFASSLTRGSASVVDNTQLVSKIYFPRLILPLSGVLSPVADFGVAFVILIGMMVWFGISPTWGILALPLLCSAGHLNRSRHRSLAFSIEREVPRRWPCGTLFGPNLDVRNSRNLSGQLGSGKVAATLQPQPHGWSD